MNRESIKVTDMILWDRNPRFPDDLSGKSEKELIHYMFSEKARKNKMIELTEAIIRYFHLPPAEALIIFDSGTEKICYEGNRRLMIYKLLLNPSLLDDERVKVIFEEGKDTTQIGSDFPMDCLVTKDEKIAIDQVKIKHLYGNNHLNWGSFENANFKQRIGEVDDKTILQTGIRKIVNDLNMPEGIKQKVFSRGFSYTFERILTRDVSKEFFQFKIENGKLSIGTDNFENKLKVIILNVVNGKAYKEIFTNQSVGKKDALNSRTLNLKEDIKKYLNSIDDESISRANEEIANLNAQSQQKKKPAVKPLPPKPVIPPKPVENPRSTERKHLIPDNFSLRIEKGKVNDIYLELKKHLVVRDTPNAVAVLFRVFLEGTVNSYAEKYGFSFEKKTALTKKIEKVAAHLENQHGIGSEKFRKVKNLTNKNTRFLSVEDFHYYVHDNDVKPLENDLRVCWNDLQEFFEIVYNQIQKDKK